MATTTSNPTTMTTGQVADACSVAQRTVAKWFDSGLLSGFRIPGSKDRRFPRSVVIQFMAKHGIPLGGLAVGQRRLLVLTADAVRWQVYAGAMDANSPWVLTVTESPFAAAHSMGQASPHAVLLDGAGTVGDVLPLLGPGAALLTVSPTDSDDPRVIGIPPVLTVEQLLAVLDRLDVAA